MNWVPWKNLLKYYNTFFKGVTATYIFFLQMAGTWSTGIQIRISENNDNNENIGPYVSLYQNIY